MPFWGDWLVLVQGPVCYMGSRSDESIRRREGWHDGEISYRSNLLSTCYYLTLVITPPSYGLTVTVHSCVTTLDEKAGKLPTQLDKPSLVVATTALQLVLGLQIYSFQFRRAFLPRRLPSQHCVVGLPVFLNCTFAVSRKGPSSCDLDLWILAYEYTVRVNRATVSQRWFNSKVIV